MPSNYPEGDMHPEDPRSPAYDGRYDDEEENEEEQD